MTVLFDTCGSSFDTVLHLIDALYIQNLSNNTFYNDDFQCESNEWNAQLLIQNLPIATYGLWALHAASIMFRHR